ncbi:TPA: hypothetical protein ROY17_005688 [Bacillus thuringiensis]|nr:hypothetical protein [Bacillus thuringiensis]
METLQLELPQEKAFITNAIEKHAGFFDWNIRIFWGSELRKYEYGKGR